MLNVIDDACRVIAFLNARNCTKANVVNMSEMKGCQHLVYQHLVEGGFEPRCIKQRTDTWFVIRKKAKVTGSTLYNALGPTTLKHFDEVISHINKPEPSESVKNVMQYGVENEKHFEKQVSFDQHPWGLFENEIVM